MGCCGACDKYNFLFMSYSHNYVPCIAFSAAQKFNSNYFSRLFISQSRVFGRLVLIPFLEGRRSPDGLDAQQRAEIQSEETFSHASSAIGLIVGLSQQLDFLLKQRTKEITSELAHSIPELDDRCQKNYAILICFAEKVKCL